MKKGSLYLDNNASTPLDPLVKQAIEEELLFPLSNPSSPHATGQQARGRLDRYRRSVAAYFKAKPQEVIFTSSGTEAMNFLITSALKRRSGKIITSELEHSCVFELLKNNPNALFIKGVVTPEKVEELLDDSVSAIALMAVNNETGVKTDIVAIGKLAEKWGIPFIVDGVAWLGKERVVIPKGVAAVGFSGHKVHAPTGIGFALVRPPFKAYPLIVGGAQEYGLRGGTENMLGIAALARAMELIPDDPAPYLVSLRERFESEILKALPSVTINGATYNRSSNVSNIHFPMIDGETLLMRLDERGVACSLGSACTSGALEPSRVLIAMGLSQKEAKHSLRFSFGRMTTPQDIDEAINQITCVCGPGSF